METREREVGRPEPANFKARPWIVWLIWVLTVFVALVLIEVAGGWAYGLLAIPVLLGAVLAATFLRSVRRSDPRQRAG